MTENRADLIARELDQRASRAASSEELDNLAAQIPDAEMLWSVADRVAPEIPTMGAIYRRALAIEAPIETAIGYLALAHLFNGNDKAAVALIGNDFPKSLDPVLLDAWTALVEGPGKRIARIREALRAAPHSLRLWRSLASAAIQENAQDVAGEAYLWLARHETNPTELQRIEKVLRSHGWLTQEDDIAHE